jgi:hypothetical protein
MTRCRFESLDPDFNASNCGLEGSPSSQKGVGNVGVAPKRKKRPTLELDMFSEVFENKVVLELPIRTVSEANNFETWQVKHKRHKAQQKLVALALKPLKMHVRLPCKVLFTRYAPRTLDAFENLPMSFKYIADAVCAVLTGDYRPGRADGDTRITLACDQVKSSAYGVKIEITY